MIGALLLIGACTDDTGPAYTPPAQQPRPPQPLAPAIGTFHVVITTTGVNADPDGYMLTVDDTIQRPVRANDTIVVANVVIDRHTLRLGDIATNCVPDSVSSRSLTLISARDTTTQLAIKCLGSTAAPELAGLQLLFERRWKIYRITIGDGATPVALAAGDEPTWSPDGQRIAFVRNDNVYVMDADGANERLIATGTPPSAPNPNGFSTTEFDGATEAVAWSPDGTRLALYSDSAIVIVPVDGAAPAHSGGVAYGSPTWSPDGQHVAFVMGMDVYVGDVNGSSLSNTRKLTDAPTTGTMYLQPAWSPDGKQIAMAACDTPHGDNDPVCAGNRIMVMNADGSRPRTLAYASGLSKPAWTPDGQTIAFANTCWDYGCPSAVLYVSVDGTREGVLVEGAQSPSLRR